MHRLNGIFRKMRSKISTDALKPSTKINLLVKATYKKYYKSVSKSSFLDHDNWAFGIPMRLKLVLATRREPTARHVQILKAKRYALCSLNYQLPSQEKLQEVKKFTCDECFFPSFMLWPRRCNFPKWDSLAQAYSAEL